MSRPSPAINPSMVLAHRPYGDNATYRRPFLPTVEFFRGRLKYERQDFQLYWRYFASPVNLRAQPSHSPACCDSHRTCQLSWPKHFHGPSIPLLSHCRHRMAIIRTISFRMSSLHHPSFPFQPCRPYSTRPEPETPENLATHCRADFKHPFVSPTFAD